MLDDCTIVKSINCSTPNAGTIARDANVVCYKAGDHSSSFSACPCSCASTVFTACSKMMDNMRASVVSAVSTFATFSCPSDAVDADSGIVR